MDLSFQIKYIERKVKALFRLNIIVKLDYQPRDKGKLLLLQNSLLGKLRA